MSLDSEAIFDEGAMPELSIPEFDGATEPSAETEEKVEAAPAPEAETEEPGTEVEKTEPVAAPVVPPAKVLKFKAGDTEHELAETAVVPWKVDGKTEMVAVKDLLTNYAGKVAYDRKFNELAKQREEALVQVGKFENDRKRHSALINDMHQKVTEGKTFEAVESMLEMTGLADKMDSRTYVSNLRNAMIEQAKQLAGLSPEQRQIHEMKEETDFLRSKYARETQRREQEQVEKTFQERVAKAVSSVNSSVEEFVKTRDWITQELQARKEDASVVTPEYVATHIQDLRDYTTAKEAITAVNPDLIKNEKLWDDTVKLLRMNPEWTAKDVEDVLRSATKQKRSANISAKVKQAPEATAASASTKKPVKDSRVDFKEFSASDLEW